MVKTIDYRLGRAQGLGVGGWESTVAGRRETMRRDDERRIDAFMAMDANGCLATMMSELKPNFGISFRLGFSNPGN